eukprot:jgi/Undpi1/12718/HiC_scaffold_6.g02386.m1
MKFLRLHPVNFAALSAALALLSASVNVMAATTDTTGDCVSEDGISDDTESRWSCELGSDPEGGLCKIDFVFEDPQDIMEVQVAFYKGEERTRTLEVTINGVAVGKFDSYKGSTFNALGVQATGVSTLTLTSVGPAENGWISLIEVRFLVEA